MKITIPRKPRALADETLARRWHGAIDGIHRGVVYGWAIDAFLPNSRVVLEVCLDDEPLRCVFADVARTDLANVFSTATSEKPVDACHGFVADIGTGEKLEGILSVRVANTTHLLEGAVGLAAAIKPPVAATSNVHGNDGLRLHGWAIDWRDEKRSITVSAYLGSYKVSNALADRESPALRANGIGAHAFTLDLPLFLGDGQTHEIRVVDEDGLPINGSPITICAFADGIRALLPDGGSGLLGNIVDSYERHLPRSLGLKHFAEWISRFGSDKPPAQHALTVSLIVTGLIDDHALNTTLASVKAQIGANVRVFFPTGKESAFDTLLKAARKSDVIGCIRAGDTLVPHGIARALAGFTQDGVQIVYTDSVYQGTPWFKPAWNRDYAYATDYPLELMLVRSKIAPGTHDPATFAWESIAVAAALGDDAIVHVPHVVYEYRSALTEQELQTRAAASALAAKTLEPKLSVMPEGRATALFQPRRATRQLTKAERNTAITLIIPTRDYRDLLERCITSIKAHTHWSNLEIIVIDNGSEEAATKSYFRSISKQGVRVLSMPGEFNFADLNNRAVALATGDIIGLINNDIEALHDGWMDEMVAQLMRPNVGVVGAKLLWPNGMVQHGGIWMGVGYAAGHYGNLLSDSDWGDHGRNQLAHQVTGVTAACLFMRRSDYIELGGMDAHAFPVAFNDVDLCLKVRAAGKLITWTPYAKMLHAESASRGNEDSPQKLSRARREVDGLRKRWGDVLLRDPAYHPSLNLDLYSSAFGGLAIPPRDRTPRTSRLATVTPAQTESYILESARSPIEPLKQKASTKRKATTRIKKSDE